VDGTGDGLDVLFTDLVVEIFDAPFYRRGAMLAGRLTASNDPATCLFLTFMLHGDPLVAKLRPNRGGGTRR
jgi:hypothetical protein